MGDSDPVAPSQAVLRRRLVAIWMTVLAGAVGWSLIAAAASRGDAVLPVAVIVGTGAVFLAARAVAGVRVWIVPAAVVTSALVLGIGSGELFSTHPIAGPFEYTNAAAAWYLQAVVAGVMIAFAARMLIWRLAGASVAAVFAIATIMSGSAASAVLLVLPGAALVAARTGRLRAAVVGLGLVLAAGVVGTTLLGAIGQRSAAQIVDERRAILWEEAYRFLSTNPLVGIGPGRFDEESPTARADEDARWAHNEFLQVGAEAGVPGLILLTGIFFVALAIQGSAAPTNRSAALAAAAVGALGLGACVDYLLHFAALPITAAALAGAGAANIEHVGNQGGDARW